MHDRRQGTAGSSWAPPPGPEWCWVGELRARRLRREGILVATVTGILGVLTLVLLVLLDERLPVRDRPSGFYLVFGMLAPFGLLVAASSGLLLLRWVRGGYVRSDGASRLRVGVTMAAVAALLALIGTAIVTPPTYGHYSLATLPALVILVAVSAVFLVRFRGMAL